MQIITGPNMGGKSSCTRMIALCVLLAQIGSYVPATSVTLGMHDAIHTRMGASDEYVCSLHHLNMDTARSATTDTFDLHLCSITGGKSTFMVEISETSDIMYVLQWLWDCRGCERS